MKREADFFTLKGVRRTNKFGTTALKHTSYIVFSSCNLGNPDDKSLRNFPCSNTNSLLIAFLQTTNLFSQLSSHTNTVCYHSELVKCTVATVHGSTFLRSTENIHYFIKYYESHIFITQKYVLSCIFLHIVKNTWEMITVHVTHFGNFLTRQFIY